MGILTPILRWIGARLHPKPRPIALESSLLGCLPLELIIYIAQFLPPESTLSFSLCCWPIYSILKSQYTKIIKDDQELNRYEFLALLERDLPGYILCYHCRTLHAIKKAHQYSYEHWRWHHKGNMLPCCKADFVESSYFYIHPAFSVTAFQMAMKLYRQGLDHSKLLKLLSYHSDTYADHTCSTVEKCNVTSKIVAGYMIIREQRRFMIPSALPVVMPTRIIFAICPHIKFSSVAWYEYRDIMDIVHWRESRDYQNGNRLTKCKYCFTEFRIDFKEFGRWRGNAIYITKWQDLGPGLSPLDPKLRCHISRDGPFEQVEFDLGSICSAFEGKEHDEFEFDNL